MGIEPTTCRGYSHTLVSLRLEWIPGSITDFILKINIKGLQETKNIYKTKRQELPNIK